MDLVAANPWLIDTILPMALVALAAVVVPHGLRWLLPRSVAGSVANVGISVLVLAPLGAVLMAAGQVLGGQADWAALRADPAAAVAWLGRFVHLPALMWGPVLVLAEMDVLRLIAEGRAGR